MAFDNGGNPNVMTTTTLPTFLWSKATTSDESTDHWYLTGWILFIFTPVNSVLLLMHAQYVWLFLAPWTVAHLPPLSLDFPRQEYWSGLPFPIPGDLPNPGIQPVSPASLPLVGGFFTIFSPGKPKLCRLLQNMCIALCQGDRVEDGQFQCLVL